jgi:hypothetical protein
MEIDFCPRWVLAKLRVPEQSRPHLAILISTLLVVLLVPIIPWIPHFCLMKKVLGIACPGCGISHSVMAVFRLDPAMAWRANPAGIGVAAVFFFQIAARPVALALPRTAGTVSLVSHYAANITMVLLFVVWAARVL